MDGVIRKAVHVVGDHPLYRDLSEGSHVWKLFARWRDEAARITTAK